MDSTGLYQPLDASRSQIRLLDILDGAQDDIIKCSMTTVDGAIVDIHPTYRTYDALSYEWGDQFPQRLILVEGRELMIRETLWNALNQLRDLPRSLKQPRRIWIDAICINQQDREERNAQVDMMHSIYVSAWCVRVWLGQEVKDGQHSWPATVLLEKIFWLVREVESEDASGFGGQGTDFQDSAIRVEILMSVRERLNLYKFFDSASRIEQGNRKISRLEERWQEIISNNEDEWLSLACLLNRTYWSRMWIVQEYVLPFVKRIHCGQNSIELEILEVALAHILRLDLSRHPEIKPSIQKSIFRIQSSPGALIVKYASPWLSNRRTILEIITACKNSHTSEPRDKIYAIIGLAWDIWHLDIVVDYAKSITEIKFDVLRSYLSINQREDDRKEVTKLWIALNEMLPEKLDAATRDERERMAQSIINEVLPILPHAQQIKHEIKQLVSKITYVGFILNLNLMIRPLSMEGRKHHHGIHAS